MQLAKKLITENKDVVLIEKDPVKAKKADNALDCLVLQKNGAHPDTLKSIEPAEDDVFISVTDSDEVNMIAANIAKVEFNAHLASFCPL